MTGLRVADLHVGDERKMVLVDDLTRTQIVQYAGASSDFNPVHSDEVFAREVAGYPGVFAHGMLTMGMAGRILTDWVGDGRLTHYGAQFRSQVWPGDTLTATARIEAVREDEGANFVDLSLTVVNQRDETVLLGDASARVDP
jgi:acyl dehydratase